MKQIRPLVKITLILLIPILFVHGVVATKEFVIIQFTENNILTPNITGGNVKINPFFVIVGLVIGAIIWGLAGMIVVVPILAMARIVMRNTEKLKPYAHLLDPRRCSRNSITSKIMHKTMKTVQKFR